MAQNTFSIHRLPVKVEDAMIYFIELYGISTIGYSQQQLIKLAKSKVIFQSLPNHVQNYINYITKGEHYVSNTTRKCSHIK